MASDPQRVGTGGYMPRDCDLGGDTLAGDRPLNGGPVIDYYIRLMVAMGRLVKYEFYNAIDKDKPMWSRRCHLTIEIDGVTIEGDYHVPPVVNADLTWDQTFICTAVRIPEGTPNVPACAIEVGKWYVLNNKRWDLTPARLPI